MLPIINKRIQEEQEIIKYPQRKDSQESFLVAYKLGFIGEIDSLIKKKDAF